MTVRPRVKLNLDKKINMGQSITSVTAKVSSKVPWRILKETSAT